MIVGEIMSTDIVTITPDSSFQEIWKTIFTARCHMIPVVDKKNRLVGIVTRQDLLSRLYPKYQDVMDYLETPRDFEEMEGRLKELSHLSVRDVMKTFVIFARESTLVMRALSRMIVRHVDQLPIVNDDDELVGIITKGDIFASLFVQNFGKTGVSKQRPANKRAKKTTQTSRRKR